MTVKQPAKKPTRKLSKAKRNVGGRPTKYLPAYAEQARKLALLGFTDERMAAFFEVEVRTIYRWKAEHVQFCQAVKAGKYDADATVASSLYQSALGGGTVTEVKQEIDAEGRVVHRKTVKELPANVTAQIFWLKNRQPRLWREKIMVEDETPPDSLAERAKSFEAIMAGARKRQRQVLIERGILPSDEE